MIRIAVEKKTLLIHIKRQLSIAFVNYAYWSDLMFRWNVERIFWKYLASIRKWTGKVIKWKKSERKARVLCISIFDMKVAIIIFFSSFYFLNLWRFFFSLPGREFEPLCSPLFLKSLICFLLFPSSLPVLRSGPNGSRKPFRDHKREKKGKRKRVKKRKKEKWKRKREEEECIKAGGREIRRRRQTE